MEKVLIPVKRRPTKLHVSKETIPFGPSIRESSEKRLDP